MSDKALEVCGNKAVAQTSSEQIVGAQNAYRPNIDIFHTPDEFIFLADMPGVRQGDVELEINERNTLIFRARNSFEPQGNLVLRQVRFGNYYRSFELGDNIDRNKISAKLDNGVLEIRVAKKEQAKPRKIEIQV
jgi:HSP20 family protein